MNYRQYQAGNAVLISLFIAMFLMALLAYQVVTTRANLNVTEQRTATAQLTAQSVFSTARAIRTATQELSGKANATLTVAGMQDGSRFTTLSTAMQIALPCNAPGERNRLFVAQAPSCGESGSGAAASTATSTNVTKWQIPLLLRVSARLPDGTQRTRQVTGSLSLSSSTNAAVPLNVSAMQLLVGQVVGAVPGNLIFDGPVHSNATVTLEKNRSEWPGGLTSASPQLVLGTQTLTPNDFGPNPAFPCDQATMTCPNFGGGLALKAPVMPLPDAQSTSGALHLSGNVRELVLFPVSGGTGFFACTTTACDVYHLSGNTIWRIRSGVAVPARDGSPVDTTPLESAMMSSTQPLIIVPGDLEVRSLTPTGAAYRGTLSIMSRQTLTIGSSLLAQTPVCTTYPVRNDRGSLEPAVCGGVSSPDALGLIAERGNINVGQPAAALVGGDTSLTLQAALLAPRGRISLRDSRITTLDWIGSATAATFEPSARMRLAHDPRALAFPGFPALPGGLTPARVSFDLERGLD